MTIYAYSLQNDFADLIDLTCLQNDIISKSTITTELNGISINGGDNVDIEFISDLSGPEETALDECVVDFNYGECPQDENDVDLTDLSNILPIEPDKFLKGVDSTTTIWADIPGDGNYINFSYSHGTKSADGLKIKTKSWVVVASFIYDGSDLAGLPEKLKVLGHSKNGSTSYVRIYDYTNNKVIAQVTVDDSTRQIWIDNTIENLPTDRAIFEVQGKVQDSKKYLYVQAIAMGV